MRYFFVVLVLLALAFGGGFWLEHRRMESVQQKLDVASAQLSQEDAAFHLCRLQDQLLTLVEATANRNYGDAAAVSTKFFNELSDDVSHETDSNVKSAMQSILAQRDQVTSELAKGDPAAHELFVQMSSTFHDAIEPALGAS